MRHLRAAGLSVALGLSMAVAAEATPAAAAQPEPEGELVSGGGDSRSFYFEAGREGAVYRLRGGARLVVSPGARMRRFPGQAGLHLGAPRPTPTHVVVVRSGRVDVEVPPGASHAVMLKGPQGLAGICVSGRATLATAAGGVAYANHEGDSRSTLGTFWEPLAPGRQRALDDADRVGAAKPLIDAPVVTGGGRVFDALQGAGVVHGLSWSVVRGASGYLARLVAADGREVARQRTRGPGLEGAFAALAPGRYSLVVQSLDGRGVEGRPSAPVDVSVVGVTLPPGAYVQGHEVKLSRGQAVGLIGVEALEMTYERSTDWIRAPKSVALFRGAATTVRFRAPGGSPELAVRLEPRSLRAEVHAGPKTLVWPDAPAKLTVRVSSDEGVIPEDLRVVPRVTLGLEPLEVQWSRQGDLLTATVPPREGPGPWVLRVQVEDQHGLLLGRDFVEIERSASRERPSAQSPRIGRSPPRTAVE